MIREKTEKTVTNHGKIIFRSALNPGTQICPEPWDSNTCMYKCASKIIHIY